MDDDGEVAAAWQGRVSQRWVDPALCLLHCVMHNAQGTVKVLNDKAADIADTINRCKKRKRGGEDGGRESKAQLERKQQHARYNNITSEMSSLKFHVYHACLQDILSALKKLSLLGQEHGVCGARVAHGLKVLRETVSSLQVGLCPYERFARDAISIKDSKPRRGDWVLDGTHAPQALHTKKALLNEFRSS